MTDERLAEIRAELVRCAADTDYYVGGLASAGLGLELIGEIDRLRRALGESQQ